MAVAWNVDLAKLYDSFDFEILYTVMCIIHIHVDQFSTKKSLTEHV